MEKKGFNKLCKVCSEFGLCQELAKPIVSMPDAMTLLGVCLDAYLKAVLDQTNGAKLWNVFVFGGDGSANNLVEINHGFRKASEDVFPSLNGLLIYAQIGYQETYLATVSAVESSSGRYPVVLVDLNEEPIFLPIASNVDLAFEFIARYLKHLVEKYGSVNTGVEETLFPWDVPKLITDDRELMHSLKEGRRC